MDVSGSVLRRLVRRRAWWVGFALAFVLSWVTAGIAAIVVSGWQGTGGVAFSAVVMAAVLAGVVFVPPVAGQALAAASVEDSPDVSPGRRVAGTWFGTWLASLGIVSALLPALLVTGLAGGVSPGAAWTALGLLAVLIGVFTAIGVGLSGLVRRRGLAVLASYVVVLMLAFGTSIAFAIAGSLSEEPVVSTSVSPEYDANGEVIGCLPPETTADYGEARNDRFWGLAAVSPFVIVADAAAVDFTGSGQARDLFGMIGPSYRGYQVPPELEVYDDFCASAASDEPVVDSVGLGPQQSADTLPPIWPVGLGVEVMVGALALLAGWLALRGRLRRAS